jgi:hypothetical protein
MVETYQALEGELTVRGTDASTRSGDTNAVAIVGGYDASNAASSVTAGEATEIQNATTAEDTFGASELARAAGVVAANGVGEIYGVPVTETSNTETFGSSTATASGTISDAPIFDTNLHPDHSVTVTDVTEGVECDVSFVYNTTPSQPSTDNAVRINPITGEWAADTSSQYDFSYTYGDYTPAIQNAVTEDVRYVIVLSEASSVKSTLVTELDNEADDFNFKRGIVGATPSITSGNISSYTPSTQDWRLIEVAPARATSADGEVRTAAAVGGFLASQPIGPDGSGLYDEVSGLSALATSYRPSEVKNFSGVTALTRNAIIGTAETTSTKEKFKPIYGAEIIDDVASGLFVDARDYAGGPQDTGDLEARLSTRCQGFSRGNPPHLGFADDRGGTPYDVDVNIGSDNTIANASVVIVPYPIAETVNLDITVADGFVEFGGAT